MGLIYGIELFNPHTKHKIGLFMKVKFVGRREPYTTIGIKRKKCQRCGSQAHAQWQCCANGNRWLPVCRECDIELNAIALKFFKIKYGGELLGKYVEGL